jgi:hypothetical protein
MLLWLKVLSYSSPLSMELFFLHPIQIFPFPGVPHVYAASFERDVLTTNYFSLLPRSTDDVQRE